MRDNLPITAQMTAAGRRAAFMRAGLAAGFDTASLLIMFSGPASIAEHSARPRLGALTDAEWRLVKPLIPLNIVAAPGGAPRDMIDAALWRARHGSAGWRHVPSELGSPAMLRQKWARWVACGALTDLMAALPGLRLSEPRRHEFEAVGRMLAKAEARAAGR